MHGPNALREHGLAQRVQLLARLAEQDLVHVHQEADLARAERPVPDVDRRPVALAAEGHGRAAHQAQEAAVVAGLVHHDHPAAQQQHLDGQVLRELRLAAARDAKTGHHQVAQARVVEVQEHHLVVRGAEAQGNALGHAGAVREEGHAVAQRLAAHAEAAVGGVHGQGQAGLEVGQLVAHAAPHLGQHLRAQEAARALHVQLEPLLVVRRRS